MTSAIDNDLVVSMYKEMCFFRRFEERVGIAYTKRKFSGFCHLHIGQEALAVGTQSVLTPNDYMISGYRSHTQAIGKGVAPGAVMAELFGKEDGCCRGKGGSMHNTNYNRGKYPFHFFPLLNCVSRRSEKFSNCLNEKTSK